MLQVPFSPPDISEEEIKATCEELHLDRGGVKEAIIETGKVCREYVK